MAVLSAAGVDVIHGLVIDQRGEWWNPDPPEQQVYNDEFTTALKAEGPYSGRANFPPIATNGVTPPPPEEWDGTPCGAKSGWTGTEYEA